MRHLLMLSFVITIYSSVFLITSSYELEAVNICAYSADPVAYPPNCYNCPKVVYSNALLACLNATTMPKNITYKGANCMEQNCKIVYPQPTPETEQIAPFWEAFSRLFMPNSPLMRSVRSIRDNSVDSSNSIRSQPKMKIVGHVVTLVERRNIEFGEPEYDE